MKSVVLKGIHYCDSTSIQLKVEVSKASVLVTVKLVLALIADTVNDPTFVVLLLVSVKNTRVFAVTEVFAIVTVPAVSVPVPMRALEPDFIIRPLPAAVRDIFPVAVIALVPSARFAVRVPSVNVPAILLVAPVDAATLIP